MSKKINWKSLEFEDIDTEENNDQDDQEINEVDGNK